MSGMFCGCSSVKELDVSDFITNKVTNFSKMFNGCYSIMDLNTTNFNTSSVNYPANMPNAIILN